VSHISYYEPGERLLAIEFRLSDIPFIEQPQLHLEFKGNPLKCKYIPDFRCYEEIIKARNKCGVNEETQIINAIKAAKKRVGVLINFGEPSLYWKKYVNSVLISIRVISEIRG